MATITLEITPELERQLREEAARQGLEPNHFILNALAERLRPAALPAIPHLSELETELLQQINLGLSAQRWEQYHAWVAKRRAETLTPDEQTALITLSDEIEQANAHRIRALIKLAELRGQTLAEVMQALGINPPAYV
jgi:hypothetical protein